VTVMIAREGIPKKRQRGGGGDVCWAPCKTKFLGKPGPGGRKVGRVAPAGITVMQVTWKCEREKTNKLREVSGETLG